MKAITTDRAARVGASSVARYAIYFAPPPGSPWSHAGACWLGRDAYDGRGCARPVVDGVPPALLARLTAAPSRYGLHATLKAPFHLAAGSSEDDLLTRARTMAAREQPLALPGLRVQALRGFLALMLPPDATTAAAAASALAMRCVRHFEALRAPPGEQELARRLMAQPTPRQAVLLTRWGYPFTEEEFCLHLTLTDRLDGLDCNTKQALENAARQSFAAASTQQAVIDALTIFRQVNPDAPFLVWRRLPFAGTTDAG